ncbi:hypothetical protein EVAR_103250_1 [Eumeta japonica]|uniref:Uncharacterized protein n=1 Tax=Eumeta variegata TaxID=151549 RepID=A0A4C2A495_EUMVA|nr:hypothetical protein EVAR_103250_1 [Eumeta japonica]
MQLIISGGPSRPQILKLSSCRTGVPSDGLSGDPFFEAPSGLSETFAACNTSGHAAKTFQLWREIEPARHFRCVNHASCPRPRASARAGPPALMR